MTNIASDANRFSVGVHYGNLHHFLNFTEQRVKTIKDLPARITAGRQSLEAKGGKIVQYYLTLGAQDAVVVCELPDDETMAGAMLAQAGLGNLRTTTMRAFTEAKIPGVVSQVSL